MSAFYSRRIGRAPTGAVLATEQLRVRRRARRDDDLGRRQDHRPHGERIHDRPARRGDRASQRARARRRPARRATQEVEPLANYFVGRVKRDFDDGNLVVGGMASGVSRNIDTTFAPRLARHAEMYGNDMRVHVRQAADVLAPGVGVALTNVSGDAREILLRQQSSARYFQRPDRGAGSGGFLSNRLRLDGDVAARRRRVRARLEETRRLVRRTAGQHRARRVTRRTTTRSSSGPTTSGSTANIGRLWTKPTSWYRQIYAIAGGQDQQNFEGDRTRQQLHAVRRRRRRRSSGTSSLFHIHRPSVDRRPALRGGPVGDRRHAANTRRSTSRRDSRHEWVGNAEPDRLLGRARRPEPRRVGERDLPAGAERQRVVRTVVEPVARRRRCTSARFRTATATAFYGTRYVIVRPRAAHARPRHAGQRDVHADDDARAVHAAVLRGGALLRTSRSTSRRARTHWSSYGTRSRDDRRDARHDGKVASYTIDPDGTGPASPFTIANPDFSAAVAARERGVPLGVSAGIGAVRRMDAVALADSQAFGDLDFDRDRSALFAARPDNVFLVKASWWLPR